MVLGTPRGLRENAPSRVAVRTAMQTQTKGSLGPGVLGALPGATPGGREEPGRDAQSRIGAFQGGKDGFLSTGSKAPPWTRRTAAGSFLPTHTAVVLCTFCPPNIKLHRCSLLAPAPSAGSPFPQSPFSFLPSASAFFLQGQSGSNGDSLSCTEGESGALPAHPFGVAGRRAMLAVSGAIIVHGNDK